MAKLIESNDAVKVAIRQRLSNTNNTQDTVVDYEPKSENIIIVDDRPYCFDHVLEPTITQQQLYDRLIKPLVEQVKRGYNCTALAYGQTGTGKSYTMGLSSQTDDEAHVGVVNRCLWDLLKEVDEYEIKVSFVEIYNEKVFDLLATSALEPIMSKGLKYVGGTRKSVVNVEECNNILMQGITKRHVRPTVMNSQSSRSHVIFTIEVIAKSSEKPTRAHLNLVDLAGSEGVRRTGHKGLAMSEGVHINQGLLCISKILQAMSEGHKIIPYRDSVLGSVLQDSLSPSSYLTLLACISAKRIDLSETLSTIRFAQRAKQIKRTPQLNSILTEITKNNQKTPHQLKTIMRNNNDGQTHHTFCTPGKVRRIATQLNRTEFGLTPKEKEKVQNRIRQTGTVPKRFYPKQNSNVLTSTAQRESLFDHTMESWNLNVSTSTTLDAPSTMSYSPIVQKCMEKFEILLENKMQALLKNISKANPFDGNPNKTSNQTTTSEARYEMKNIMREIMFENQDSSMNLLRTSSPKNTSDNVFKVPEIPRQRRSLSQNGSAIFSEDVSEVSGGGSIENSVIEQTALPMRRSIRISDKSALNKSNLNSSADGSKQLRRSTRLHSSVLNQMQDRRRSIRIAANLEKDAKKERKARNKSTWSTNDNVLANYFDSHNSSGTSTKAQRLARHRKAILELLNNGSIKTIQALPQIGQKTAFKLITYRTLNGKFKNLAAVENLPIWRGNSWERFAKENFLV